MNTTVAIHLAYPHIAISTAFAILSHLNSYECEYEYSVDTKYIIEYQIIYEIIYYHPPVIMGHVLYIKLSHSNERY